MILLARVWISMASRSLIPMLMVQIQPLLQETGEVYGLSDFPTTVTWVFLLSLSRRTRQVLMKIATQQLQSTSVSLHQTILRPILLVFPIRLNRPRKRMAMMLDASGLKCTAPLPLMTRQTSMCTRSMGMVDRKFGLTSIKLQMH